jgi:small subunit ribosomal protein S14
MAKKSSIEKNERRKKMTAQHAVKRAALKAVMQNPVSSDAEKRAAQVGLQKLPRNSAKERIRNRC